MMPLYIRAATTVAILSLPILLRNTSLADSPPGCSLCPSSPVVHCNLSSAAIPDTGTLLVSIAVPREYILYDVNVCLNITHPRAADLELELRAPESAGALQARLNIAGSASGADYACTRFSDGADTAITQAVPPYSGLYRPLDSFIAFRGGNGLGTWTLAIRDRVPGNAGTFGGVCLELIGQNCLPVNDLTIALQSETGRIALYWTVADTSLCRVWSTTTTIASGDDTNPNAPAWILESELPYGAGAAVWEDPHPLANSKAYVVERLCISDWTEAAPPPAAEGAFGR